MTIHISLDLETWGTRPGSDLRSIGAVVFDPSTGYVPSCNPDGRDAVNQTFYRATDNPIVEPTLQGIGQPVREYALFRDPDTEQWWNEQSAEAQAAFSDAIDLDRALYQFGHWLIGLYIPGDPLYRWNAWEAGNLPDTVRIWSHGAAFDPPILAAAYDACGLPVPWHYRAPRDTRTAFDMAGITDHSAHLAAHPGPLGVSHHALDDAICQARAVCAAVARVNAWNDSYQREMENG